VTADEHDAVDYQLLRRLFDQLSPPTAGDSSVAYSTEPLPGESVRLGKDRQGNPALIMPLDARHGRSLRDRHYANLRLRHALNLKLEGVSHDQHPHAYSVVECVTDDVNVVDWFLRLLPAIYEHAVSPVGGFEALDEEIARIGELFRRLDSAAQSELKGLWAELTLILNAHDVPLAVQAWHAKNEAVHDFTVDGLHVEVKCTEGPERRHTFSSQQLQPLDSVIIASFVVEVADGPSVLDLYEELSVRLAAIPDLQHKVQTQVLGAVGRRLREADEIRFDPTGALRSLRFVPAINVPHLSEPFPPGVSYVRFTSDLSSSTPLSRGDQMPALARNLLSWVAD